MSLVEIICSLFSIVIILSCLVLKIPQIVQVQQTQSANGILMQALVMEIFSYTTVMLYNYLNEYSLMTYLEYPIILLQIYVLLFYVLKYKKMLDRLDVTLATIAYIFFVFAFSVEALPKDVLTYILPMCTPISGFAKVTHIYGIVRDRNADSVSLTTWVISVCTNLGRLFTVYVDSGDTTLIFNFIISTILSMGVLGTAFYYQNNYCIPTCKPSEEERCRNRFDNCVTPDIIQDETPSQRKKKRSECRKRE